MQDDQLHGSCRLWLPATALAWILLAGACTDPTGDASTNRDVTVALWLMLVLGALVLVTAGRWYRRRKRRPSFEELASRAVQCGELLYQRLAAELALASIDGAIPQGLKESERMLDMLAGQLAAMAASPVASATTLALEDLREEVDNLRSALRRIEASPAQVQTKIPATHRQLVIFEVALRTFRNQAGRSS